MTGEIVVKVVVLGGGFGGVAAANELRGRLGQDDEVVLIDRRDTFAMGFAKLWDLAGVRPIAQGTRSLRDLARKGIRFVEAEITGIDADARYVATSVGGFDAHALVIALGSTPSPTHRQLLDGPGAHDLYDQSALPAMRADLDTITAGRVVVTILGGPFKCPPAPYEAALIVDGLLRDRGVRSDVEVVVTSPQPMTLPVAGVDASRYVASHLDDHGVGLRSGHRVTGIDADRRRLTFAEGAGDLDYDLLLGVPADTLPDVLEHAGLAGASGWLEPDPGTLRLAADRVVAVGDCTMIPTATAQLPHAGVFAAEQGRVAARNLVAELDGRSDERFDGHGYCFLELPGEQVAFVEGDFYADPPDVTLTPADHEQFRRKQAYERDHLAAWFG
jgi:sulfide:quinone oxidoreductase